MLVETVEEEHVRRQLAGLATHRGVGTCAYVALVALLSVTRKRTLLKLNAFDFVFVTVALSSTLSSVRLSPEVALAEAVLGMPR